MYIDSEILARWNIYASQIKAMLWEKWCNWYILFFIIIKTQRFSVVVTVSIIFANTIFKTSLIQRYSESNEHTMHKQVPLGFLALPSMLFCGDDWEPLNVLSPC